MLPHAAYVAAQPNSSLNAPSAAIAAVDRVACRSHSLCSSRLLAEVEALSVDMVFSRSPRRGKHWESFGSYLCHPVRIPSSSRDHASGPFRRPAARRRSAFSVPPQNKFESRSKERCTNFFWAHTKKALLGTWEPGPLARFA